MSERVNRYLEAFLRQPQRFLVAAFSEATNQKIPVSFLVKGDPLPIYGVLPDKVSRYLYLMEGIRNYEPETLVMMNKALKKGDTCFVIGAHIGIHAILAKQEVGKEGKVIAFEPTPETYSILETNCKAREIKTEKLAITKEKVNSLEITVFDTRYLAWNSSLTPRLNVSNVKKLSKITVRSISINEYCYKNQIFPDALILDLENGEMDAIEGGLKVIQEKKPNIIIECGDLGRTDKNSTKACLNKLREIGYSFYEADPQNAENLKRHEIKDNYPDYYPNILAMVD